MHAHCTHTHVNCGWHYSMSSYDIKSVYVILQSAFCIDHAVRVMVTLMIKKNIVNRNFKLNLKWKQREILEKYNHNLMAVMEVLN